MKVKRKRENSVFVSSECHVKVSSAAISVSSTILWSNSETIIGHFVVDHVEVGLSSKFRELKSSQDPLDFRYMSPDCR